MYDKTNHPARPGPSTVRLSFPRPRVDPEFGPEVGLLQAG